MSDKIKYINVGDLLPDDLNFNKGTEYGGQLLEKSFERFGAGRSILIDKNNRIIAGNKATEKYGALGGEDVIIIETDGTKLVAVKRTDIDLNSKEGRELALADNATQKADLDWDQEALQEAVADWQLEVKEWGVSLQAETEGIDIGGLFGPQATPPMKDDHNEIVVLVPQEEDLEQVRQSIQETIKEYKGVYIK